MRKWLDLFFHFVDLVSEHLMTQQHGAPIKAPPGYCATAEWLLLCPAVHYLCKSTERTSDKAAGWNDLSPLAFKREASLMRHAESFSYPECPVRDITFDHSIHWQAICQMLLLLSIQLLWRTFSWSARKWNYTLTNFTSCINVTYDTKQIQTSFSCFLPFF